MHTRRSFRPLAIALPFGAAATVAVLLAAQGADAPGDPLVAGFKSTLSRIGLRRGRARHRQERDDAL